MPQNECGKSPSVGMTMLTRLSDRYPVWPTSNRIRNSTQVFSRRFSGQREVNSPSISSLDKKFCDLHIQPAEFCEQRQFISDALVWFTVNLNCDRLEFARRGWHPARKVAASCREKLPQRPIAEKRGRTSGGVRASRSFLSLGA